MKQNLKVTISHMYFNILIANIFGSKIFDITTLFTNKKHFGINILSKT